MLCLTVEADKVEAKKILSSHGVFARLRPCGEIELLQRIDGDVVFAMLNAAGA